LVDEPPNPRIAAALRAYLAARPGAIDTAGGIRAWWLAELDPVPEPAEVERALHRLELDGEVERVRLPDGGVLWRAARRGR
jgi:hypothetical protein